MQLNKDAILPVILGLLLGVLWLVVVRALFFYPEPTHYHANFAVFINGEQQTFDSPIFYEEVQACTQDEDNNPRGRVHLHQPDYDVVHVHDEAATWGHLFANLGWSLGNDFIETGTDYFRNDDDHDLVFLLNDEPTRMIANRVIGDGDRLLISFDTELSKAVIAQQRAAVPTTAAELNQEYDPAGCSGSANPSLLERLRFGLLG